MKKVKRDLENADAYGFEPDLYQSVLWSQWIRVITPTSCDFCRKQNGRIINRREMGFEAPPVHKHCRCKLKDMLRIKAGTATVDKERGADYTIKHFNVLPDNYVTKKYAELHGWDRAKGNLRNVLPGATIHAEYHNVERKLPTIKGRRWYEADVNYNGGYRNKHRLFYSNDGLIFVSYDHAHNFYEVY